ncbi:hypothetical protein A2U01_0098054, partial [Trifolium medium]|nr:hypothetical protein [Trifolium medium]
VEGVCFNVWVVEEKGRERLGVALADGVEDYESRVVPSEVSGEVEVGCCGDVAYSGEDEESGPEGDVDNSMQQQH